ncbi:putative Co/Zn/Cd efflux system membrane fusion protein [Chitinispirillum alkaliphilum]|nr:putative Co/Zn/Cd efflux system membrane fusion protein [Chitinispirillum alkaliphilum]
MKTTNKLQNVSLKLWGRIASVARNRKARTFGVIFLVAVLAFRLGGSFSPKETEHAAHDHEHTHEQDENGLWTCSMHPQIVMEEPGQCPICHMDLIPMPSDGPGSGDESERSLTLSNSAIRLSRIVTAPVARRGGDITVRLTGRVVPDERRVEAISSRINGRIDRLVVNETGTAVRRGAALAVLYSPELMSLQQELISAASTVNRLGESASALVKNSAEANLRAAKEKLRLLGFSDTELDNILEKNRPSEHMTVRAAQSGTVLHRAVDQGDYVKEGTPLFHIADLSNVWLHLDAYEKDLPHIRLGQEVEFTLAAIPGETYNGTVSFIDPVINPSTRTANVRVEVRNTDQRLKPEMFLTARILPRDDVEISDETAPLVIPVTAPLLTGERAIVYVETGSDEVGSVYEGKEIVLGPRMGDNYIVKSGLEEGERVVVHGAFRIDSELQIRARPSMMNPEGGATGGAHAHHQTDMPAQDHIEHQEEETQVERITDVSAEFMQSLDPVYESYFALANNLDGDDPDGAVSSMADLEEKIGSVKGDYHEWNEIKDALNSVLVHREHFSGIEELRKAFSDISEQIIKLQRIYGHVSGDHYLAFCPMALDDQGAYWLQNQEEIKNPYFGASMLRCGEIEETFSE